MSLFDDSEELNLNIAWKSIKNNNDHEIIDLCNKLFGMYKPYSDLDFKTKFRLEFYPQFWEMDLACTLINGKKNLSSTYSGNSGPDICILINENEKLWIEAICPTRGNTDDQVPNLLIGEAAEVPSDKIMMRITSAIFDKHKKHLHYLKNIICNDNEPYIIAINGCLLTPGPGLDDCTPRIIKAVFEGGSDVFDYNSQTGEIIKKSCEHRADLKKYNKEKISLNYFHQDEYSNISALIYSESSYYSRPVELGSDFIIVHNPIAKNPLPDGFLKMGTEYKLNPSNKENSYLEITNHRCYNHLYK